MSEEILEKALLKDMKPLKIDCLPREIVAAVGRKAEWSLLHVNADFYQAEIVSAITVTLKKRFKMKKN